KEYKGKRDMPTKWVKKQLKPGEAVPLPEMGANCATYMHTELEVSADVEMPLAINTGGNTLTIGVNREKVFSEEKGKAEPVAVSLKLKKGKNELMVKMCNAEVPQVFTLALGAGEGGPAGLWFEDASAAFGFGPDGLC